MTESRLFLTIRLPGTKNQKKKPKTMAPKTKNIVDNSGIKSNP
jgi:hypothetical protein